VRAHLLKIPKERQTNVSWQSITRLIMAAAQSGETIPHHSVRIRAHDAD
jgi:hypothetical protein